MKLFWTNIYTMNWMKTLLLWKSSFLYEKTNERTLLPLVQKGFLKTHMANQPWKYLFVLVEKIN